MPNPEQQIIDTIELLASRVTLCSPHHFPQGAEVSIQLPSVRPKSFFRAHIKCSLSQEYFAFPFSAPNFACAANLALSAIVLDLCWSLTDMLSPVKDWALTKLNNLINLTSLLLFPSLGCQYICKTILDFGTSVPTFYQRQKFALFSCLLPPVSQLPVHGFSSCDSLNFFSKHLPQILSKFCNRRMFDAGILVWCFFFVWLGLVLFFWYKS